MNWTPEMDEKLDALYIHGQLSATEAAKRMGIGRGAVIGRASRLHGRIFPSNAARNRVTADRREMRLLQRERMAVEVLRARNKGLSRGEMAERFDISRSYISYLVKKFGAS
jgi:hypothetical protein